MSIRYLSLAIGDIISMIADPDPSFPADGIRIRSEHLDTNILYYRYFFSIWLLCPIYIITLIIYVQEFFFYSILTIQKWTRHTEKNEENMVWNQICDYHRSTNAVNRSDNRDQTIRAQCAPISKLPSNICTMDLGLTTNENKKRKGENYE